MKKKFSRLFCLLLLFQVTFFAFPQKSKDYDWMDEIDWEALSEAFESFSETTTKKTNKSARVDDYELDELAKALEELGDIDWDSLFDDSPKSKEKNSIDWDSIDWDTLLAEEEDSSKTTSKTDRYSSSNSSNVKKKLSVWSFTDEIESFLNAKGYGYKTTHPNVEVEYTFTPTDQFPSKLDPVLATGRGAPDVFGLEDAFVRKYVESGLLLPLDDLYAEVKDKMVDYPIKIGSYNGHVYALPIGDISPGAVFYRRSLAKKYWGTDNPVEVQKKLRDFDTFLTTARQLKKDSNGKCRIVSTSDDLFKPYLATRKKPWVVDDKLYIDPAMEDYMEMLKIFHDEKLDGGTSQWAEGWYAGMNDKLKDEKGNNLEIMCYFLPTWGLKYVLRTDAVKTAGDWAMCAGPSSWRWGGTWIAAYKRTKLSEAAKEMIRYLATNDNFLEEITKVYGYCVGNINVQNKIKGKFSEVYLGGQNHYEKFCEMAKTVDGSLIQGTDQQIENLWSEVVTAYARGERTKQQALVAFKYTVAKTMGL